MRTIAIVLVLLGCGGATASGTQCELIDYDASVVMECTRGSTCSAPLDDPTHPGAGGLCR